MLQDDSQVCFDNIPKALKTRQQWVLWRNVERDGKATKLPYQVTGGLAKSDDPATWNTFETVCQAYDSGHHAGIGFVFAIDDPLVGIDLDACRDPQTGELAPWAQEIIDKCQTYAEVSPSGTGVKLFAVGKSPFASGKNQKLPDAQGYGGKEPGIEIYSSKRYFAVTGKKLTDAAVEPLECAAGITLVANMIRDAAAKVKSQKAKALPVADKPVITYANAGDPLERARAHVATLPPAVSGDNGSNQTFAVACVLVRKFGLDRDRAMQVLNEYNARCLPPWTAAELEHKLDDAITAVQLDDLDDNSPDKSGRDSTAEKLVQLALAHFRFGISTADQLFAVDQTGGPALLLRGNSDSLRQRLAKLYRQKYERTPNASALADALNCLAGEALDAAPEELHLRLAKHCDGIIIDLGDKSGRAVEVTAAGWQVLDKSPVLFRRSALTRPLPLPERGGTLGELFTLLNVSQADRDLIVGWLVAALIPSIPHPILLLMGVQGTGKSSAARVLVNLFDPSAAPLRSEPRDMESWQIAAAGSWGVCVDNLSKIPPWLSDSLCKAVTGDGLIRRALYTDGDLAVSSFRRVIVLTSIDAGALRADLGERLLLVELDTIPDHARRTEQELDSAVEELQPRLFGAVLDTLCQVLAELPKVKLQKLPRMADFAKVLAAADKAGVTRGAFDRFMGLQGRIAGEVLDGDPFATTILERIRPGANWTGTASELLSALWPNTAKPPEGWPSPRGVTGRLKRLIPALATQGLRVTVARENTVQRRRLLTLTRDVAQNIVQCVQSSNVREGYPQFLDDKLDDLGRSGENIVQSLDPANNGLLDDLDDLDDKKHPLSGGIGDPDFIPVDPELGF